MKSEASGATGDLPLGKVTGQEEITVRGVAEEFGAVVGEWLGILFSFPAILHDISDSTNKRNTDKRNIKPIIILYTIKHPAEMNLFW
ncbi:MAG: hypothetical protein M3R47_11880, partial [Chloroflexota bacterium]|nr:hypothetical protein [Chloroflexota bacterium]